MRYIVSYTTFGGVQCWLFIGLARLNDLLWITVIYINCDFSDLLQTYKLLVYIPTLRIGSLYVHCKSPQIAANRDLRELRKPNFLAVTTRPKKFFLMVLKSFGKDIGIRVLRLK